MALLKSMPADRRAVAIDYLEASCGGELDRDLTCRNVPAICVRFVPIMDIYEGPAGNRKTARDQRSSYRNRLKIIDRLATPNPHTERQDLEIPQYA
jgi:hypothetical protein